MARAHRLHHLDGLAILVLGDDTGSTGGNVEELIDLTGLNIGPSGVFLVAESTVTLGAADLRPTVMVCLAVQVSPLQPAGLVMSQSRSTVQVAPSAQPLPRPRQAAPPQSTPCSSPFWSPSARRRAWLSLGLLSERQALHFVQSPIR